MKDIAFVTTARRVTAHACHVGERINTAAFDGDLLSSAPLAVRAGQHGIAVIFRYGVVVLIELTPDEEHAFLQRLAPRIAAKAGFFEEETASIEIAVDAENPIPAGGPILVKEMSLERLLIIADVLAKSVLLARDERNVATVFEVIEPFARELAMYGRTRRNRAAILKLIGNALLVQHRMSGWVGITDKPDVLWDRPDLERLYARLEDEYELKERVDALNRKLELIAETANTLGDVIDTRRSLRLELIIVFLIAFEIVITFYQMFGGKMP